MVHVHVALVVKTQPFYNTGWPGASFLFSTVLYTVVVSTDFAHLHGFMVYIEDVFLIKNFS